MDYTCPCKVTLTGISESEPIIIIIDMTASDASEICDAGRAISAVTCNLK